MSYAVVIICVFVVLSTFIFLAILLKLFVKFRDDMFSKLLLFWSTDFDCGDNFVFGRSLRFLISRVGEVVVVLLLFV